MTAEEAGRLVRLLMLVVPAPERHRWTRELRAEVQDVPADERPAWLRGVARSVWSLRREVRRARPAPVPLWRCWLGHHRYHTMSTEDGSLFRQCVRCGRDHPGASSGPNDGVMGATTAHPVL